MIQQPAPILMLAVAIEGERSGQIEQGSFQRCPSEKNGMQMRKKILKFYSGIFAFGMIYYIWCVTTNLYIPCFYYATTGFLCPGCGMTRMFLALARLQIPEAFAWNPVVFVLLIVWNLIALLCFIGKPAFVQNRRFLYSGLGVTVAILLIFSFIRNIS